MTKSKWGSTQPSKEDYSIDQTHAGQTEVSSTVQVAEKQYRYHCPRCTGNAIVTTNKMIGVKVTCANCKNEIELNDLNNYFEV